jgi:hypothetical protein
MIRKIDDLLVLSKFAANRIVGSNLPDKLNFDSLCANDSRLFQTDRIALKSGPDIALRGHGATLRPDLGHS